MLPCFCRCAFRAVATPTQHCPVYYRHDPDQTIEHGFENVSNAKVSEIVYLDGDISNVGLKKLTRRIFAWDRGHTVIDGTLSMHGTRA